VLRKIGCSEVCLPAWELKKNAEIIIYRGNYSIGTNFEINYKNGTNFEINYKNGTNLIHRSFYL
jgi:hypothetical protein